MIQPEGFVNPKGANKMCKLQWSIYGLVQASRSWNIRFDKLIKAYSFVQTYGEACIYKKVSGRKVELDGVTVPAPLLESSSSQKPVSATPTPISEEVNDNDHETSDQVITEPRRSTRVRSAPEWYGNPILEVMLLDHDEPTNYEEAMVSPDSAKWLEAMKSEMGSMYENKVWTLIDLPNDRLAIEIKWIFKRKTDTASSVTIY